MENCKVITFEIHYHVTRRNCYVDVLRKAELTIDWDMKLNSIFKFLKDLRPVLHCYKRCARMGEFCKFELSIGQYTQEDGRVTTKHFDHWVFEGVAEDETGIYLTPNEKYTEAERDIWIDLTRPLHTVLRELDI